MVDSQSETDFLARLTQLEKTMSQRLEILEEKVETLSIINEGSYRYAQLKQYLMEGKIKEADLETTRIMLEVSGHATNETLKPEDLQQFPVAPIKLIDHLWQTYSNDRFGFSVKLKLYYQVGGTLDSLISQDIDPLLKLGKAIGAYQNDRWLDFNELEFSLDAPIGLFPYQWWDSPYGAKMINFFMMRLINLNLV